MKMRQMRTHCAFWCINHNFFQIKFLTWRGLPIFSNALSNANIQFWNFSFFRCVLVLWVPMEPIWVKLIFVFFVISAHLIYMIYPRNGKIMSLCLDHSRCMKGKYSHSKATKTNWGSSCLASINFPLCHKSYKSNESHKSYKIWSLGR